MRNVCFALCLGLALPVAGAERQFDFSETPADQLPAGFRSVVAGTGQPGEWKVIWEAVPPLLEPLTPTAPVVTRRAVLGQVSRDSTDERFPILLFDDETYTDFTFTTRFKIVDGRAEQMAGVVFRAQDENNFYVVRASARGNNFRFYKVVNGLRANLIGPQVPIPKGEWQELSVECKGNQIFCRLNGKDVIPPLTDSSFASGKIGFWTKSDSVSYFADAKISYTPREVLAQKLVRAALERYSRLEGLKIYTLNAEGEPHVIASKDEADLRQVGGAPEKKAILEGAIYYADTRQTSSVILPLRDRNGEPVAAVCVIMKRFAGQTEKNAIIRATPVVKMMQARVPSLEELLR